MSLVEAFAFLFMFICIYGGMMVIGYVVDKLLHRFFKRGIWPEDYFKW